MANQFTKAEEEGLEKPAGTNQFIKGTRTEHPEEVRARIKAGNIVARLERIVDESDNDSVVIAAGKVLLDKAISNLSSVDQTVRDETAEADPEQLKSKLKAIVLSNPALLSEVLAEMARDKGTDTPLQSVA